jgi:transmembrane sensor
MKLVTGTVDIEDEATRWLARLDSGDATHEEHQQFREWLAADGRHHAAVQSLGAAWQRFDALAQIPDDQKERVMRAATKAPASAPSPTARRIALAAGVAALGLLIGWQFWPQPTGVLTTSIGERKSFPLDDGSIIVLNTDSRVRVRLSDHERLVDLEEGQAYFDVAPDPLRPFQVRIGDRLVRALGTAFDIRRVGDDFVVVVTEGTVEVSAGHGRSGKTSLRAPPRSVQPVRLTHGEKLAVAGKLAAATVAALDSVEKETAWRSGLLEFNGETLEQVVEEFGRYTRRRIIIPSDEIKKLRVGGVFVAGDVDGLSSALDAMLPVKVLTVTPYVTVLVAD